MADLPELSYFKLTGAGSGIAADTGDAGPYPDVIGAKCDVWLRPRLIGMSAGALSVVTVSRKLLLFLAPIRAQLDDGVLRLSRKVGDPSESTDPHGPDGVWMVAQTAALNLPESARLVIDVEFGSMQIAGSTFRFDAFTFAAPTTPGAVVDLATVERIIAPSPGAGPVLRMIPDDVELTEDGLVQFYASGNPLGDPLNLSGPAGASVVIADAGVGAATLTAGAGLSITNAGTGGGTLTFT